MSDSELSETNVSDATIEEELRQVIRRIVQSGKLEELTVKRVRAAAEQSLGLEDGFLKQPLWKDRSKAFIEREASRDEDGESRAALVPAPKSKPKPKAKPEANPPPKSAAPKLPSKSKSNFTKKRKLSPDDEPGDLSEVHSDQSEKASSKRKRKSKAVVSSESGLSDIGDTDPVTEEIKSAEPEIQKTDSPALPVDEDESELSDVIDEDPKPKRRKKGDSQNANTKSSGKKGRPKADKPSLDLDPHEEEIKRLKGWLTKCGIRKMWWRELQPYDSPQAKIRHLKGMLSEAGMTGRYSVEKASQIRESRELAADLEAVQAGNKHWGKADEEDDTGGRPRRRLAKGLEGLDFLNDDDGEETD